MNTPPATPSRPGSPPATDSINQISTRPPALIPTTHTCIDPDYDGLICDPCIAEQKAEDDEIAAQVAAWSKRMKCNILLRRKRPYAKVIGGKLRLGVSVTEFTSLRQYLSANHFNPKTSGKE